MILKYIVLMLCIAVLCPTVLAQKGSNYRDYDRRDFHFGFAMGLNQASFNYIASPVKFNDLTVVNVNIKPTIGAHLGPVVSWDINEFIHIRTLLPCLSFQERIFEYWYYLDNTLLQKEFRLESTYLEFPLMFKLRTKRINNFAAYGLTGWQYSLDLASNKKNKSEDFVVRIQQHDWAMQFGGGFDFFPSNYFKFAIELKISHGLKNVLIQDQSFFSSPLDLLKTNVWWFSISFEG